MKKDAKSTVIRGVLEEELERNSRMTKRYIDELEQLPKGSVMLRKIGNQEYFYLKYRENKKIISKYIGQKTEINIKEIKEKIQKRKHVEGVLKNLSLEEKEILKALR